MKKRIFMLAVVAGLLLSLSVSAWADDYYKLGEVTAPNATYGAASTTGASLAYTVPVYFINTTHTDYDSNLEMYSTTDYHKNANLLSWEPTNFTITSVKIQFGNQQEQDATNAYIIMSAKDLGVNSAKGDVTAKITLAGNVTDDTAPVSVAFSLYSNNGDKVETTDVETVLAGDPEATTEASETVYTDKTQDEYEAAQSGGDDPEVTHDVRDYNDDDPELGWNGLDPAFTNKPSHVSFDYVAAKAKPALGKLQKTATSFTSGTSKDLVVPLTGPITELNVYVAAKDAVKLGWATKEDAGCTAHPSQYQGTLPPVPYHELRSWEDHHYHKCEGRKEKMERAEEHCYHQLQRRKILY